MPRKQCDKCPWRVDVDPHEIPDGYCVEKHKALESTIARGLNFGGTLRVMACHESKAGHEIACVGWLAHQLGPGNNIALRMQAISGHIDTDFELVGEQHKRFEDTLPQE